MLYKLLKKFKIVFLLVIAATLFNTVYVYADDEQTPTTTPNTTVAQKDIQRRIDELEKKLAQTKNQEKTLKSEIANLDNQISVTNYKIQSSINDIEEKQREITFLKQDINFLEASITSIKEQIIQYEQLVDLRIREKYKSSRTSNTNLSILLADQNGFSAFISRLKYAKVVEDRDKNLLSEMKSAENSYESQQGVLQEKKDEVEEVKAQIEVQKNKLEGLRANLDVYKEEKNNLLKITKNDETRYSELLAQAKKELDQISSAAGLVIRSGSGVEVKKGEIVGTMGNSGFSTGAHLHFGVYKYKKEDFFSKPNYSWYYSNYINPLSKLKSKTVLWSTGCGNDFSGYKDTGNGGWDWPMSNIIVTQNYGSNTCYNWMYGGKAHPALDLVAKGDISVRAVEKGEAFFCRNCLGDGGNGVFIFHSDSYMTVYWHLQ